MKEAAAGRVLDRAARAWRVLFVAFGVTPLVACGSSAPASKPAETPATNGAATATAPPLDPNRFESPGARVSVVKRPDWVFMSMEAEIANRQAVRTGNENTDKVMHDATTPPLVVIARYPEPSEKPNPTLKINLRALGEMRGASALDITRAVAEVMAKSIPSFALDDEIRATEVSGLAAGTFRAHFTLEVPGLQRSFVVKTQAWIVPRGDYGFIIAASDPTNGVVNYEDDFQAMVSTIVIRN